MEDHFFFWYFDRGEDQFQKRVQAHEKEQFKMFQQFQMFQMS